MSPARQRDDFFNEIELTLGFDCAPGQLVAFLAQLGGSQKLLEVKSIQVAPLRVVDESPQVMDLTKDVRVNITIGAVLASAPVASPAEG